MPDTSCIRTSLTLEGARLPPSGSAGADVFGSRSRPAVLHEFGALVVEDEEVLVGLDQINALAGQKPGDMEPGLTDLDDAVGGDRGAADAIPADRADLVSWPRRVGFRCRIPGLLRGDPAGQSLMGSLGVVDLVEPVDLALQFLERRGQGLFVEEAEEGLVEAFVLALCGRFIGFAGDGLNAESGDVGDELADSSAPGWVQCGAVVGEQSLRNAVSCDALLDHGDGAFGGFAPGDMGGNREAGVVVDELEDHAFAAPGQHIFGAVELPARVWRRINEPPERGPRFLPRLDPGNTGIAEDPRQCRRRRNRGHPQRPHFVVHTDRPVVQARLLQRCPNPDRLSLHLIRGPVRARPRPTRSRLQRRRLTLLEGPAFDRVERLPGDALLGAEGRHRSPRSIGRPLRNGETDTRINRLNSTHASNNEGKCQDQTPRKGQSSIDAELSEMS